MIELFYANTPNGRKISIMLEEIKFDYKITELNLSKGDQFKSDFRKISPLSKIPAITDHKNKVSLSQSGAILIYLAELSGKFYNIKNRILINQWLMAQMGDIGPMLGQHHQFHYYNSGKSKFCEETGEPIGLKRLIARPIATLSIEAQEKHEKNEKIFADL